MRILLTIDSLPLTSSMVTCCPSRKSASTTEFELGQRAGSAADDAALYELIVRRLRECKGVPFAAIAAAASAAGRRTLATLLIRLEPRLQDQVRALVEMQEWTLALQKAIEGSDVDLAYFVLHSILRRASALTREGMAEAAEAAQRAVGDPAAQAALQPPVAGEKQLALHVMSHLVRLPSSAMRDEALSLLFKCVRLSALRVCSAPARLRGRAALRAHPRSAFPALTRALFPSPSPSLSPPALRFALNVACRSVPALCLFGFFPRYLRHSKPRLHKHLMLLARRWGPALDVFLEEATECTLRKGEFLVCHHTPTYQCSLT